MQTLCRIPRIFFNALVDIFLPRLCPVCERTLTDSESCLCLSCLSKLPRTNLHREDFNMIHQKLGNHVAIDRAMAWFWYYRGNALTSVIIDAKYHDMPRLIRDGAAEYAAELEVEGCPIESFADIIVPSPMHWTKRIRRTYNQSEWLADGLSRICGLPVVKALRANRSHRTQTRLSASERLQNLQGSIELTDPALVSGRRVLLVDDILTTGATMRVALEAIAAAHPASISVITLGAAKKI